jgi:hypothetical protein
MTELSYLDIYPSNRIADQLEAEDPEFKMVGKLLTDAKAFSNIMEQENLQHLRSRNDPNISSRDTYKFLRSQERTRNTRLILQYLVTFVPHLPMVADIEGKPVNPFEQMKSFALYNISLLKEPDVSNAILKEHERLGLLNDTNTWYYRGQIDKNYKALKEMVENSGSATIKDYRQVFGSLQKLATFWFSVRNQDFKRVRKSDLFIYKLTRVLMHKWKEPEQE